MNFRDLEKETSKDWLSEDIPSSLAEWYFSVRDVPLINLSVADVCRALRQNLFISHVLPIAMTLLNIDVLAGDKYDGELVVALSGLSKKDWQENKLAARQAIIFLDLVKKLSRSSELLRDVSTLADVIIRVNAPQDF